MMARMTAEASRIQFLLQRDGPEATRAWVSRTLRIYRESLDNRASHVAAPEFRPLFEQAIRDFEAWLASLEPAR